MNLIRQQDIMDQLANILNAEAPEDYQSVSCRYKFEPEYMTITSQLSYVIGGEVFDGRLSPGVASENLVLTEELRDLMQSHTGGVWEAFTLTLDRDGKAHCTFEYPQ